MSELEINDAIRVQNQKDFDESLRHIQEKPYSALTRIQIDMALAALAQKEQDRLDKRVEILKTQNPK